MGGIHAAREDAVWRAPATVRAVGGPEDGFAGVVVLALCGVLVLLGGTAAAVGMAQVARHRAASVADLAALAGARQVLSGAPAACAQADRIAGAAAGRLLRCVVVGDVVEVVAEVRPPGRLGLLGAATARARAGPADAGPAPRVGLDQSGPTGRP